MPAIGVIWSNLNEDDDDRWDSVGCLYAYLHPHTDEVLYIGKAWGVTVRRRWTRAAKPEFWEYLEARGIKVHRALLGEIDLPRGQRLTQELLSDIESLLIYKVQPGGNIQSRKSRISRPGMTVRCRGDWPHKESYIDMG